MECDMIDTTIIAANRNGDRVPTGKVDLTGSAADPNPKAADFSGPALAERASFVVHKVNAHLARLVNRRFRHYDLDLYSTRILVILLERPEIRVGELVEMMELPQSTISHQLQRLERRKLIKRRRARNDNRSVTVVLTPQGHRVALECNTFSLIVWQAITNELSDEGETELRRLLHTMLGALAGVGQGLDAQETIDNVVSFREP
jgi:DNA-binding MarR family transcriptional regulator